MNPRPPAPFVIAIDGHAASGKGTLARNIAAHYNFAHLDSGKLYRLVAWRLLQDGSPPFSESQAAEVATEFGTAIPFDLIDDDALKTPEVSAVSSKVASFPQVRENLKHLQKSFAAKPTLPDGTPAAGTVIDGRDIGTVICPDAHVKLFITADLAVRATRRQQEISGDYHEIYAALKQRDFDDENRAVAPLRQAEDAVAVDTSALSIEAATRACLSVIGDLSGHLLR